MHKCPNCGSMAQYQEYSRAETETTIIQIFLCGCGYRHQVFWTKALEVGYLNGKKIYRKRFENKG